MGKQIIRTNIGTTNTDLINFNIKIIKQLLIWIITKQFLLFLKRFLFGKFLLIFKNYNCINNIFFNN